MRIKKLHIEILRLVANESTCYKYKIGAVIFKNGRPVSSGYNGSPSHMLECIETYKIFKLVYSSEEDDEKLKHYIERLKRKYSSFKKELKRIDEHILLAEELKAKGIDLKTAISKHHPTHSKMEFHAEANAIAAAGTDLHGATILVTHSPCYACAQLILLSGISEVYYIKEYVDPRFGESSINFLKDRGIKVRKIRSDYLD